MPSHHFEQSGGEVTRLPVQQNHSDCSKVAQRTLVLGLSGHVELDPIVPAQSAQYVDLTRTFTGICQT